MPSPLPGFDDSVQLAIEPVYGLRMFFGGPEGLWSVHQQDYRWTPGVNKNFCYTPKEELVYSSSSIDIIERRDPIGWAEHDVFACSCGFYGYHTREHLESQYMHMMSLTTAVIGVIKATGKMVLGEKGFRAEKAEVVAVAPGRGVPQTRNMRDISTHYEVPLYPNIRALLLDHPTTFGDLTEEWRAGHNGPTTFNDKEEWNGRHRQADPSH